MFFLRELVAITRQAAVYIRARSPIVGIAIHNACYRCLVENRIHLEIWFLVAHRRLDPVAIFQEEEIAQKWGNSSSKSTLPVCNPNIGRAADCLLRPFVEVVAKG